MINVFINKAFFKRNHNEISREFQNDKTKGERKKTEEEADKRRTGFYSQFAANEAY